MTNTLFLPLSRAQWREAGATGLGFALGFGWLWFSGLHYIWLPRFLWGTFWSGGGTTVFLAVLLAGFFVVRLTPRAWEERLHGMAFPADRRRTPRYNAAGAAHGLSFGLLVVGSLAQLIDNSGFMAFVPVLCAALAALCLGVFWGASMLRLTSPQALAAFGAASLAACCLGFACEAVPLRYLNGLPPVLVTAAWALALWIKREQRGAYVRLLEEQKSAQRRLRGRPPKKKDHSGAVPGAPLLSVNMLVFPALAFVLLSFGTAAAWETAVPGALAFPPPWLTGLLTFGGAGAAALAIGPLGAADGWRDGEENPAATEQGTMECRPLSGPRRLFLLALTAQSALLLLYPAFFPFMAPVLDGVISAVAFFLLANAPMEKARPRAALGLGLVLLLGLAGSGLGTLLRAALALPPESVQGGFAGLAAPGRLAGLCCAAATACLLLFRRPRAIQPEPIAGPGSLPDTSALAALLTPREEEIARLVAAGKSNRETADHLGVSEATVRFHLRNIYQKAGVNDRDALAMVAKAWAEPDADQ